MHIFGVVIWLGGLMYQGAVALPVVQGEGESAQSALRKISRRFIGFVWMSAWMIAVTGLLLMLLSPRFFWFRYDDAWSVLLGLKQAVFLLMVFYAFGFARMLKYLDEPVSNGGFDNRADEYRRQVSKFRSISIFLGITGLLLSAGMATFG